MLIPVFLCTCDLLDHGWLFKCELLSTVWLHTCKLLIMSCYTLESFENYYLLSVYTRGSCLLLSGYTRRSCKLLSYYTHASCWLLSDYTRASCWLPSHWCLDYFQWQRDFLRRFATAREQLRTSRLNFKPELQSPFPSELWKSFIIKSIELLINTPSFLGLFAVTLLNTRN